MTSSRFDPGSTSVRPQKPWTSPFYGSMNGPGLKTLVAETKEKAPKNATYTSPKIQEEILHVYLAKVEKAIWEEISNAK